MNPLNRFQPGFISFTLVVLNECEGPHCRTLQNFLITCQKKRFFASAQNDEKPVIASDSGAIFHVCHCERSAAIYSIQKITSGVNRGKYNGLKFLFSHFITPRNDEKTFIPSPFIYIQTSKPNFNPFIYPGGGMMALTINTNLSSLMVQLSLKKSTLDLNRALEQMTTGYRINSAKDDAAGYAVATKMDIDLSSYRVAQNNANLGLSLLNTTESSLDIVTTHLQRIRDLAEQAANGTYGQDSIDAIQMEIDQRTEEIKRIMETTEYNGIKVFGDQNILMPTGEFIKTVQPLTEEEAIAQGYTLIKSAADLDNIRNNLNGKYILMNDIDLSGVNWDSIGDSVNPFSGELNGNGFVIHNLTINNPSEDYQGLFGYTNNVNIQNLGLENVKISGNSGIGALTGYLSGTLKNCYVTGVISGVGNNVGGLVGETARSTPATIENSYVDADISGYDNIGGLIGYNSAGLTVNNCYSVGSVDGHYKVAGLAGYSYYATFSNCYSASSLSGNRYVAGLVGYSGNSFNNCYFDTTKTGTSYSVGSGTQVDAGRTTLEINNLVDNGILPAIAAEQFIGGQIINLQVGIDSSRNSIISFDTSFSLDFDIKVSTFNNAQNALNNIDNILSQITSKQTLFGAVQNRLESVIDSLDVSIENTTSSLSTIKDADIAKVSSDFIRAQILQQASAALLATANQSPSIVLGLI